MININDAIKESKTMKNISNGGSACFDFGDVVLVKYVCDLKYLQENCRVRENQESVMEGINEKIKMGVNTPIQYEMARVIEGDKDVCYVLQQKCPGVNLQSKARYGSPYEDVIKGLEETFNIPFEHYVKLVSDGCNLLEMGCETKPKNLFYDQNSGFWYIDFLENNQSKKFDLNNPVRVFEAIKYVVPSPRRLTSLLEYGAKLSEEKWKKHDLLVNSIEAKYLLAIREAIPNFSKYEKFFLINKDEKFKKYLMDNEIVKKDLFRMEKDDYPVYNELYEIVIDIIVDKIANKGEPFWSIKVNAIKNDSNLFGLRDMWKKHQDNQLKRENYLDEDEYAYAVENEFTEKMLNAIAIKLAYVSQNDNVKKFLEDMALEQKSQVRK